MKSTKEFWKVVNRVDNETSLEVQLEELEFEYCLPKWAWTLTEWTKFHNERRRLIYLLKEELSSS